MAKAKQKARSAAKRREQERQQRQQRLAGSQIDRSQARSKGPKQRQSNQRQWLVIGGVLAILAVIIGAFIIVSHLQPGSSQGGPTQASSQVFNAVTQVKPDVLLAVGTGGVQNPLHTVKGPPPVLLGPTGKPEFFYAGGEFCPYCAAERWSMVVALSHFGTFGHLDQIQSAENNISTFTFYHSTYTSSYVDFVPIELNSNGVDSSGSYATLQTPTTDQQKLISTYDAPPYAQGGIPFISIANQYVLSGGSYNPQVLLNSNSQSLSWQDIANSLSDSTSTVAKGILGTANYLTAGICMVTHQQPANVCSTDVIQKIEQSLGKSSVVPGGTQIAVAGHLEAVIRRERL